MSIILKSTSNGTASRWSTLTRIWNGARLSIVSSLLTGLFTQRILQSIRQLNASVAISSVSTVRIKSIPQRLAIKYLIGFKENLEKRITFYGSKQIQKRAQLAKLLSKRTKDAILSNALNVEQLSAGCAWNWKRIMEETLIFLLLALISKWKWHKIKSSPTNLTKQIEPNTRFKFTSVTIRTT